VFYGEVNGGATVPLPCYSVHTRLYMAISTRTPRMYSSRQYADGIQDPAAEHHAAQPTLRAGKLPEYALFSLTPPAPEFASMTPPDEPFESRRGVCARIWRWQSAANSYRLAYLGDAQAHPTRLPQSPRVSLHGPCLAWRQRCKKMTCELGTEAPGPPMRRRRRPTGFLFSTLS